MVLRRFVVRRRRTGPRDRRADGRASSQSILKSRGGPGVGTQQGHGLSIVLRRVGDEDAGQYNEPQLQRLTPVIPFFAAVTCSEDQRAGN
jgi:hypothetical protein